MLILWNQGYLFHCFVFLHIESLFVFPCQWNYRPDHCIYGSNCQEAEEEGIFVLHGNRGVYHDDKQPAFRAIYEALRNVSIFLKSFYVEILPNLQGICKNSTKNFHILYSNSSVINILLHCFIIGSFFVYVVFFSPF